MAQKKPSVIGIAALGVAMIQQGMKDKIKPLLNFADKRELTVTINELYQEVFRFGCGKLQNELKSVAQRNRVRFTGKLMPLFIFIGRSFSFTFIK